jgi:hypothetical protein
MSPGSCRAAHSGGTKRRMRYAGCSSPAMSKNMIGLRSATTAIVRWMAASAFVADGCGLSRPRWRGTAQKRWPGSRAISRSALDRVGQRVEAAARRVLSDHAILRFRRAWIINGLLTLSGFVVLASRALQSVQQRRPGTELVVLALGGSLVIAAILSPLDWDRYYLFPVLFAGLCSATSIAAAVDLVRQRLGGDGRELA